MKNTALDIKRHIQKYLTITFSPISTFDKVKKALSEAENHFWLYLHFLQNVQ